MALLIAGCSNAADLTSSISPASGSVSSTSVVTATVGSKSVSVSSKSGPDTAPKTVIIDASWATYYSTMAKLRASADIVVRGTIEQAFPAVENKKPGEADGYYTTDFRVNVTGDLLNRHDNNVNSALIVTQTGGVAKAYGVVYETRDDPLFNVGDDVILFLIQYAPGKYRVSGGPSGRFSVTSGSVSAIVKDGVPVQHVPLQAFVNAVTSG